MGLRIAGPAYNKSKTIEEISDNTFRHNFSNLTNVILSIKYPKYHNYRKSIEYISFRIFNSNMISPLRLFSKSIKYSNYHHIKRYPYMNKRIIKEKNNNNDVTLNDWYFTPVDINYIDYSTPVKIN